MNRKSSKIMGLTLGSALALSSVIVAAPSADAAAAGCTVNRYITPPVTHYNTGSASCTELNGGTKMRVVVTCSAISVGYGPWVTSPNKNSVYVCGNTTSGNYPDVGYQTS